MQSNVLLEGNPHVEKRDGVHGVAKKIQTDDSIVLTEESHHEAVIFDVTAFDIQSLQCLMLRKAFSKFKEHLWHLLYFN